MRSLIIILVFLSGCGSLNNPIPEDIEGYPVSGVVIMCGHVFYKVKKVAEDSTVTFYSLDYVPPYTAATIYGPAHDWPVPTLGNDGYYEYAYGWYGTAECHLLTL